MIRNNKHQVTRNVFSETNLAKLEKYCESIYLVGSFGNKDVNQYSDIDILLIVRDTKHKQKVLAILRNVIDSLHLPESILDLNMYTKTELNDPINGIDHFSVWSRLETGELVLGKPIKVKLRMQLVIEGILHWLQRVNDTSTLLEIRSRFKEGCFVLYSALVWFFFIERDLLLGKNVDKPTKRAKLRMYCGEMTSTVERSYNEVVEILKKNRLKPDKSNIRVRDKLKRTKSEYSRLFEISKGIHEYGNDVYRKIVLNFGY